jgi:hypothetical protein
MLRLLADVAMKHTTDKTSKLDKPRKPTKVYQNPFYAQPAWKDRVPFVHNEQDDSEAEKKMLDYVDLDPQIRLHNQKNSNLTIKTPGWQAASVCPDQQTESQINYSQLWFTRKIVTLVENPTNLSIYLTKINEKWYYITWSTQPRRKEVSKSTKKTIQQSKYQIITNFNDQKPIAILQIDESKHIPFLRRVEDDAINISSLLTFFNDEFEQDNVSIKNLKILRNIELYKLKNFNVFGKFIPLLIGQKLLEFNGCYEQIKYFLEPFKKPEWIIPMNSDMLGCKRMAISFQNHVGNNPNVRIKRTRKYFDVLLNNNDNDHCKTESMFNIDFMSPTLLQAGKMQPLSIFRRFEKEFDDNCDNYDGNVCDDGGGDGEVDGEVDGGGDGGVVECFGLDGKDDFR